MIFNITDVYGDNNGGRWFEEGRLGGVNKLPNRVDGEDGNRVTRANVEIVQIDSVLNTQTTMKLLTIKGAPVCIADRIVREKAHNRGTISRFD